MTCDECRDLMQDLVDNEVGSAERSALEAHMTTCVECARLHRQLAKFTTTMVKTMAPLKTDSNFAGKVLARFEESKSELTRVAAEPAEPPARRTVPVWPFAAAIALCLAAGLGMLAFRRGPEPVGNLTKGHNVARVMALNNGTWNETPGSTAVLNGNRVEAVESPGAAVEVDLGAEAAAKVTLRSPCKVQMQKSSRQIELAVLQDAPGRILVRVNRPGHSGNELASILISYKLAKAMVMLGEENVVDIEPGADGSLTVSVKKGSAKIFNASEKEDVAEGYVRSVPQSGAATPAVQVKAGAFDWAEGK
ncbi:MAG: zf-HC2 domain-containing protein [Planctomycetota bacterium]|nr:zf-HC2 domain-containing protein [Planctomycetota bacterium]